jgi:G3E family GTPase
MGHCVHRSDYVFDHIQLSEFFRELPYETYRVKGWVRLATDPDKVFLIQKVGARFTVEEMSDPPKDQTNVLVFIGEGVNPFLLNIELAKCRSRSL